jgi:D-alanine-D-alanine ligase
MSIVILHNVPSEASAWQESDRGVQDQVSDVASGLNALGAPFRVAGVRFLADLPRVLARHPGATVFNLVEALQGAISDFNMVPAVCAALGHRCTGADTSNLLLTFHKGLAKHCLASRQIETPAGLEVAKDQLPFETAPFAPPWIVKPLCADGSEGIREDSVTSDPAQVGFLVRRIHDTCRCAALVEEYIAGREFGVSLLEGPDGVQAMPVAEIDFSLFPKNRPAIVDYAVKWVPGTIPDVISPRRIPADIPETLSDRIQSTARRAWQAAGCSGFARVDFRMSVKGRLCVMEINSNPDLSARGAFRAAISAAGVSWPHCLVRILDAAHGRRPPGQ